MIYPYKLRYIPGKDMNWDNVVSHYCVGDPIPDGWFPEDSELKDGYCRIWNMNYIDIFESDKKINIDGFFLFEELPYYNERGIVYKYISMRYQK